MPSDRQHTVRPWRRATFPESSNSLSTTFLVSPTFSWACVSCREETLRLEYFQDLVPEVTLLEEKVSILPCCVAHDTASMNRCLAVRPWFAVQKPRRAAVSRRRWALLCVPATVAESPGHLGGEREDRVPGRSTEYPQTHPGRLSNIQARYVLQPHCECRA